VTTARPRSENNVTPTLGTRQPLGECLHTPDGRRIEQAFAKIKALLRKAAARTVEALDAAIAAALDAFTPDECANYFTNSGYEPD
jgi:hypothetical protein